tara:strand:+ start:272 stop:1012 length:741 start_codon:yes stop_codon:yes gene_type:complete
MSFKLGNTDINKMFLGGTEIKKAYLGSVLVYDKTGTPIPIGNLIHYYKLNADSNDSVGSSDGTDTNITYTSGKTGNAATFNGSSSNILLPANVLTSNTEVSVSFFVKANTSTAEYRVLALNNNGSTRPYTLVRLNASVDDRIGGRVWSSTELTDVGDLTTSWRHIILTGIEASDQVLYVDGVQVATNTIGNFAQVTSNNNYLGCARTGGSQFLNGQMYGVGLWDTALTAEEALAVFNEQDGGNHLI